jgi:GGDEF domain-containing protein
MKWFPETFRSFGVEAVARRFWPCCHKHHPADNGLYRAKQNGRNRVESRFMR